MLTSYARDILNSKFLDPVSEAWIISEIEDLAFKFEHPTWPQAKADALHTQAQVGYLSGVMDLEREDRIEVIELIMGFPIYYVLGEWFPGVTEPLEIDNYPGPSLKDVRITRWQTSVLIDYYVSGDGHQFNETLGYKSSTTLRIERKSQDATTESACAVTNPAT